MDVGVGSLPGAVLIHDHGALEVQLVIEAGKVHQGAVSLRSSRNMSFRVRYSAGT